MNQAEKIKATLFNDIHEMASHPELFTKRPGKDFSRSRKMDVEDVLRFPVLMERDSMNRELLKYFEFDTGTPTLSAYCQQRDKLLPDTYKQLLFTFNRHFRPTLYKGKYVLTAVDGSGFNIFRNPADAETYHPSNGKSERGYNEIHVTAAYTLPDRVYTDAVIQPSRKKNEYAAACSLVDGCSTEYGIPLFLADRGFPSYNVFAHVEEKKAKFLIRAKDLYVERLLGIDMPEGEGEFDVIVERLVVRSKSQKGRSHPEKPEIYRSIDKNANFDYVEPGTLGEYALRLRVVRVKIDEGHYENLVTNLPPEEFTPDDLRLLYYVRWEIETSFRELKHAVGAADFHCKSVEHVTHEVWARLLLYNVCSRITALATVKKRDTKHVYQVNYTMAIKNCHDFLRLRRWEPMMDIVGLIERFALPIRPDRNFARQHRFQVPLKFTYRH